jgi:hypothetical protein
MASVGQPSVPAKAEQAHKRPARFTQRVLVATLPGIVGVVSAASGGIAAGMATSPSLGGGWRLVIGVLAGAGSGITASLGVASTLKAPVGRTPIRNDDRSSSDERS